MRYLAWRSRAGTSGGGGDDLAEAPPRLPNVTASVAWELPAWELPAWGRPVGLGQADRTRRSDGMAEAP